MLTRLLTLSALLILTQPTVQATWYKESAPGGSDIIMMDLRWPWWASGTYYANWNTGVVPNAGISFYAGFLDGVPDGPGATPNPEQKLHDAFRPGSVWSFWGGDKGGHPVRFIDCAPNLGFKNNYGGEGVNWQAWVGIAAFQNSKNINWGWGESVYLVQTSKDGKKSSPDNDDLGGSRVNSYPYPQDHPWVRIVRQGKILTPWTSADGQKWVLDGSHFKNAPKKMDFGIFISAIQQDAHAYYAAEVSELDIRPGVLPESTPPPPVAARNTAGDRFTGIAIARSDENTLVLRSTSKGLLHTTDGGKTWSAINGNLTGAANAVRSVAIHPTNPAIMLRAAGRVVDGQWDGGLWKTTDAGKSWTKLNFSGDFDGVGPSALCGEVIAFDLRNPDTLFVGTESKGCFKSTDGGTTWTSLGVVGERITSVAVWPWEYVNPVAARNMSHVCVTTMPRHMDAAFGPWGTSHQD